MKQELENKLYEKYPDIFCQKDLPASETCMCWGFECGDGWYNLIDSACALISHQIKYNKCPPVEYTQVKEKFGGLRIYYTGGNDFVDGVISTVGYLSQQTCETCGNPGKQTNEGWIRTLCEPCNEQRKLARPTRFDRGDP